VGRAPSPAKLANPTLLCSPDELALSDPSATRGVEWGGILQPRACPVLAATLSEVEGEVEGTCEESTPPMQKIAGIRLYGIYRRCSRAVQALG
jgi:hypothetical protein